jgi:hypothetical protein
VAQRRFLASIAAAIGLFTARAAIGGPESAHEEARRAYDLGAAAFQRADYGTAAAQFLRADELEPNDVALEAALRAVILTDEPVIGMRLVERAERRNATPDILSSADEARRRFAGRTARVRVSCEACTVFLDGAPFETGVSVIVRAGAHHLRIASKEGEEERYLALSGDESFERDLIHRVRGAAPSLSNVAVHEAVRAREDAEETQSSAIVWLLIGGGLTAIAGGGAAISAIDTKNQHDRFVSDGCAAAPSLACDQASSSGAHAMRRTNILWATTAAIGLATAATVVLAALSEAP